MHAAFYARRSRSTSLASQKALVTKGGRARRSHRWIAIIFTLTVAANFAVMPWGQPPAWLTYAPLPPLLFLMVTGLAMLVSSWLAPRRSGRRIENGASR